MKTGTRFNCLGIHCSDKIFNGEKLWDSIATADLSSAVKDKHTCVLSVI